MKKKLLITSLFLGMILTTACGTKTKSLVCSYEQKSGEATTTGTIETKFKGEEADSITLTLEVNYPDEYADQLDQVKEKIAEQKEALEQTGYTVETKSEKNKEKLVAKGTKKTLDSKEIDGKYDDFKKSLESQGYTCK